MRRIALAIADDCAVCASVCATGGRTHINVVGAPACNKAEDASRPFQLRRRLDPVSERGIDGLRSRNPLTCLAADNGAIADGLFVSAGAKTGEKGCMTSASFGVGLTWLMRAGLSPSCTEAGCIPAAGFYCADLGGDHQ